MFRQSASALAPWMTPLLLVTALLSALMTACDAPTPPSPVETDVLYRDDFTVDTGDWTLFDTVEGAAYLQQNELFIEDRGQGIGIYSQLLDREWQDVRVTVRLRQVEGSQDNWMGVTCRQQNEENYYLFAVSADGYYLLLKVENGVATPLVGPLPAEAINPGRATNTLEIRCEAKALAFSVNERALATVSDDTFAAGFLALFADGVEGQRATVAFDSLVISQP